MNLGPYYLNSNPFKDFSGFLAISELTKLIIILVDPETPHFKSWFFEFWKYHPYSFVVFYWIKDNGPVPYSMLWYSFNSITRFGYWPFFAVIFFLDGVIILSLSRVHSQIYLFYLIFFSTYFLINDPADFLIWMFLVFGRANPFFTGLAFATKLPLIPPIQILPVDSNAVWNFILNSPISAHDPQNWVRYSLMGIAGLVSTIGYLYDRKQKRVQRGEIDL